MFYVCVFNKKKFSSTDNNNDEYFEFCNKFKDSIKKTGQVQYKVFGDDIVYARKEKKITFCCIANIEENTSDCVKFLKKLKLSDDLKIELKIFNYKNYPILECQNKINKVKDVMVENVKKVIVRGVQLDELDEKTQQLEHHSELFRRTSRVLKRPFIKKTIIYLIVIFFVILLIVVIITILILIAVGVIEIVKKETT